jgi:organic hydroperoxide reductase OsmC/OhrA
MREETMKLRPRLYPYRTAVAWTDGKKGLLSSAGKRPVNIACPPEFGGPDGYWSPEDLLVASVEACIMTTFLDLLARKRISLHSYTSYAEGVAGLEAGEFRFLKVTVRVDVGVFRDEDTEPALSCVSAAADQCMVSRSLGCPVELMHTVQIAPRTTGTDDHPAPDAQSRGKTPP